MAGLQFKNIKTGKSEFVKPEKDLSASVSYIRERLEFVKAEADRSGAVLGTTSEQVDTVISGVMELYEELLGTQGNLDQTVKELTASKVTLKEAGSNIKMLVLANSELSENLELATENLENANSEIVTLKSDLAQATVDLKDAQQELRFTGDAVLEMYELLESQLAGGE